VSSLDLESFEQDIDGLMETVIVEARIDLRILKDIIKKDHSEAAKEIAGFLGMIDEGNPDHHRQSAVRAWMKEVLRRSSSEADSMWKEPA
jgi:hypothetical protein